MSLPARSDEHVFPVIAELEFAPRGHAGRVGVLRQEAVVSEGERGEGLLVVVAEIVEEDRAGGLCGYGEDDARRVEGGEGGGGYV